MIRYVRLTLVLVVLVGMGTVLSCLIGRAQQPSAIAAFFTNPDGSPCSVPCMFGLIPGHTRLTEAVGILNTHPVLIALERAVDYPPEGRVYRLWDRDERILVYFDAHDVVESISWGTNTCTPSWLLSMGDLMVVWGKPSSAIVARGASRIPGTWYVYAEQDLLIQVHRGTSKDVCQKASGSEVLDIHDTVLAIDVDNHDVLSRMSRSWKKWVGFRPASFYTNLEP